MLDTCFFKTSHRCSGSCAKHLDFYITQKFGILLRVNIVGGYMTIFWPSGLNLHSVSVFRYFTQDWRMHGKSNFKLCA